jgi:AraC-like DNA-binding protein
MMPRTLLQADESRLEGLCERFIEGALRAEYCIRFGQGSDGIERLEAHFMGQAFSPHRHDTYAIGITLRGIQTFRYCGEMRCCLPGQWHILHPDEIHDGGSGTEEGFSYRIIYVDPALIQEALGGLPLPFVPDPVVQQGALHADLAPWLWDIEDPIDDIRRTEIAVDTAEVLTALSARNARMQGLLCLSSLLRVRDLIAANPAIRHSAAEFEQVSGLDRWTVARQFRAAFGTSPSRFRTMRQLDRARRMLTCGRPLAETALEVGFADQSHMSRMFKRTYGLTAARWTAALA